MTLKIGDAAPAFSMATDGGGSVELSQLKGKKVVLYFYPKDDTSGCTKEACAFRDLASEFEAANTVIIGVSRDSVASHDKFKAKHGLTFKLGADADGKVCEDYGVWVEKSMYGKKYMGIERATFVIDEQGIVREIWRKVKVPGHADAVIEAARTI